MLENPKVNIKIRLAALWTAATFCYLYGDYFQLHTPDHLEGIIRGESILGSPFSLFMASAVMAIPPLMIVISLMARPNISKWLNIVFGTIFTAIMVLIGIGSLTPWYTFYVFLAIIESILTASIVWTAWRWPNALQD